MPPKAAPLVAALLLSACSSEAPQLKFFYFPEEVDLPPATYRDVDTPWVALGIVNETYFPLDLTQVSLTGPAADHIELQKPNQPEVVLGVRESVSFRMRVRPPSENDLVDWTSGTLEATLAFRLTGTGVIDPNTGQPDVTMRQEERVEVPVRVTIDCDLDGDGHDHLKCSNGGDCDDRFASWHPGAPEICDLEDNDCDGVPDDDGDCIDKD